MGRPKKNSIKETEPTVKSKSLFDHVNQIRNIKDPNYFKSLTEQDKKSFNHYMLCRFLSMDVNCIEEVSFLSKFFSTLDNPSFYKVACVLSPPTKYVPYIKNKGEKFGSELLDVVSKRFNISLKEAKEYCEVIEKISPDGTFFTELCSGFGMTEKEIKKILKYEKD